MKKSTKYIELKPFTVLLQYPDVENTYTAHVYAENIDDALARSKDNACQDSDGTINPNDFDPLFICAGHVENLCC